MSLFVSPSEAEIIAIGVEYLRIEGSFYVGIGYLFLLYGFYRAVALPSMSVVLTVVSLGTRVLLAYLLASLPQVGRRVERGGGVVARHAVLGDEGGGVGLGVLVEQAVVPHAEADDHVQVRPCLVQQARL